MLALPVDTPAEAGAPLDASTHPRPWRSASLCHVLFHRYPPLSNSQGSRFAMSTAGSSRASKSDFTPTFRRNSPAGRLGDVMPNIIGPSHGDHICWIYNRYAMHRPERSDALTTHSMLICAIRHFRSLSQVVRDWNGGNTHQTSPTMLQRPNLAKIKIEVQGPVHTNLVKRHDDNSAINSKPVGASTMLI